MKLKNIIAEENITPDSLALICIHKGDEVSLHGRDGSFRMASATAVEVKDLIETFSAGVGDFYFLHVSTRLYDIYFNANAVVAMDYAVEPSASGRYVTDLQIEGMHEQVVGLDKQTLERLCRILEKSEENGKSYRGTYEPSLRGELYNYNVNLGKVRAISTLFGPVGPSLAFRFAEATGDNRGEFSMTFRNFEDFGRRVDRLSADTGFKLSSEDGSYKVFTPN